MDLHALVSQWTGKAPPGFPPPATVRQPPPRCSQRRCERPCATKKNGEYARSCSRCLARRAQSCQRRRTALVAEGGCRRCAYRKRLEGDFLCARCREDRDLERRQKHQDALAAAAVDEFAAKTDRAREPSNLDCGVSPWNGRRTPQPSAAYWSPLPDPEPREDREWATSIYDTGWRCRRH